MVASNPGYPTLREFVHQSQVSSQPTSPFWTGDPDLSPHVLRATPVRHTPTIPPFSPDPLLRGVVLQGSAPSL